MNKEYNIRIEGVAPLIMTGLSTMVWGQLRPKIYDSTTKFESFLYAIFMFLYNCNYFILWNRFKT